MRTHTPVRIAMGMLLASIALGTVIQLMPDRARTVDNPQAGSVHPEVPAQPRRTGYPGEVHERFQQAALMLHSGNHLYALEALERVIELAPALPEARVNAGFALLGLGQPARAAEQFGLAIELRPGQANAYYGLAVAMEHLDDIETALGAMRTFVHLTPDDDAHERRAWAAIWEWEQRRGDGSGAPDARNSPRHPAIGGDS